MAKKKVIDIQTKVNKTAEMQKKLENIKELLRDCQTVIDSSERTVDFDKIFPGEVYTDIGIAILYLNAAIATLAKKGVK